jgi:hypothetical protein
MRECRTVREEPEAERALNKLKTTTPALSTTSRAVATRVDAVPNGISHDSRGSAVREMCEQHDARRRDTPTSPWASGPNFRKAPQPTVALSDQHGQKQAPKKGRDRLPSKKKFLPHFSIFARCIIISSAETINTHTKKALSRRGRWLKRVVKRQQDQTNQRTKPHQETCNSSRVMLHNLHLCFIAHDHVRCFAYLTSCSWNKYREACLLNGWLLRIADEQ